MVFDGEEPVWRNNSILAKRLDFHEKTFDFYVTSDKSLYRAKRHMNPKMMDYET